MQLIKPWSLVWNGRETPLRRVFIVAPDFDRLWKTNSLRFVQDAPVGLLIWMLQSPYPIAQQPQRL